MSELSIRVETIALSSSPTTSSGQIDTPNQQGAARGGSDPLSTAQVAAKIGDPVPIVFGRRVDGAGGVLISPKATEARFENDETNAVTASYHLVLSEGQIDGIQVRDVFQQSCRVGTFTQAYDRRAGDWGPGNFITAQTGFEDQVPDCPIYCGSGTGSYGGMTTGSFENTIPNGFTQWDRQVHAFVRGGMHVERFLTAGTGPSNNVADLVRWMMRRSSRVPEALIDATAMLQAARFTNANGLWCNIKIDEPANLADWLAENLGYFLLRESRRNGRKGLQPLLPFNPTTGALLTGAIPWTATFNEDLILPGSVEINYSSRVERQPFCVQVVWRQQPDDGLGLARTAEIRYGGSALDGPFEQHDLSAFCTTEAHAFRVGAYILARRRYIDHRMTISLRPGAFNASLAPGDIVRVILKRIPSLGDAQKHDFLYEVDRVARSVAGEIQLELTHFPVDDQGRSLVALDVSRAVGNGLLLPTGRAPVDCDLNDDTDTSVNTDLGPWGDWEIAIPDPPLYDLDLEEEWPDGIVDNGDGWGPGGVEDFDEDFDDTEWEAGTGGGGGGGGGGGDDYTATVSFSQPLITYPDVWYAILENDFATATFTVSVDNPPLSTLYLTIVDGSQANWDPENGEFGGGNAYTVMIPEGQTSVERTINVRGDSFFTPTARELRIINWSGGGYQAEVGDALDVSATQAFTVQPYVGSITLQPPGLWLYDSADAEWDWAGPAPSGFEFDVVNQRWSWTGTSAAWAWAAADQRWEYIGSAVSGWEWLIVAQRWRRTMVPDDPALAAQPEGPPAGPPSPLPASIPAEEGFYTVVAQATVDKPPIPNGANDLVINLVDFSATDSIDVGALIIPAVSVMFGSWRWVAGPGEWTYPSAPADWRWAGDTWEYLLDSGDWSWNQGEGEWQWGGVIGEETTEPSNPPAQDASYDPPDGARWLYVSGAWQPPVSGGQVAGGTAPDFTGLLIGRFTYHLLTVAEPEP